VNQKKSIKKALYFVLVK